MPPENMYMQMEAFGEQWEALPLSPQQIHVLRVGINSRINTELQWKITQKILWDHLSAASFERMLMRMTDPSDDFTTMQMITALMGCTRRKSMLTARPQQKAHND